MDDQGWNNVPNLEEDSKIKGNTQRDRSNKRVAFDNEKGKGWKFCIAIVFELLIRQSSSSKNNWEGGQIIKKGGQILCPASLPRAVPIKGNMDDPPP